MDYHIQDYYRHSSDDVPMGHFHKVICLQNERNWSFSELDSINHPLPKGWYELARLSIKDRIGFTQDFWLSKIPFHPRLDIFIEKFFSQIDDVGIYLVQKKFEDPFEAHMVYSLKDNRGFFRGLSPASESEVNQISRDFEGIIFPQDYLSFMQIHNGFCKTTDTGLIRINDLLKSYEHFQSLVGSKAGLLMCGQLPVDPHLLFPFYESFGMPFYQCFYGEWYPEEEMGNVYYSGMTNSISDLATKELGPENMAFATFTDWLMFYLETIEA